MERRWVHRERLAFLSTCQQVNGQIVLVMVCSNVHRHRLGNSGVHAAKAREPTNCPLAESVCCTTGDA